MADEQNPDVDIIKLNFEKDTLHKLYQTGFSHEINPKRWERVRAEIRFEDVVADLTGHSGSTAIRCPFHGSDSRPSFWLYRGSNDGWCFGCLSENEPIWTAYGLKRIGDVRVGDRIYDRYGRLETVLHTESKQGTLLAIETSNFRWPLLLTPDHTCFYVKHEEAVSHLPYLVRNAGKVLFLGSYKKTRKLRKMAFQSPITEGRADRISVGDYMLFPVSPTRHATAIINPTVRLYVKGTVASPVPHFPITEIDCRLYGLYVAEGSTNPPTSPRTVRWTFHINEAGTLGTFIQATLLSSFNLNSTLFEYPEHNTCEVVCSSVELARGLSYWFGSGAENKKIPPSALLWPVEMQQAFIDGYLEGDGEKAGRGRAVTVSESLAHSLWAVGVQAGKLPSLGHSDAYVGKLGLTHQESWTLEFCARESKRRFFQEIDGHNYYWSQVSKVEDTHSSGTVVDIIVSGSESFLTKMAAVHNCPPKEQYYDQVRFVARYLDISRPAALRWLENKWDLPLLPDEPVEDEDEEYSSIELQFEDLQEPYILRAIKQVQEFQDVELAEDYLRYYFKAIQQLKLAEQAKKEGEGEESAVFEAKAATTLARVLGKEQLRHIFARKEARR